MTIREIGPSGGEWSPRLDEMSPGARPERLFAEGLPLGTGKHAVAVVGSRRPTAAGVNIAREIARGLAEAGLPVVSGLAMGIDAAAHEAALEAGGYTVAVLGCGLDVDYPRRNARLRRRIATQGTILSEYEPGTQPRPAFFPARNRVIAGLCEGVVVVEGSTRSGGLITARWALDLNRSVFAVPGSTRNPLAAGPNDLIRTSQATLVTGPQQIIEDLAPGLVWEGADDEAPSLGQPLANEREARVLLFLDDAPTSLETICRDLDMAFGEVAIVLAALEVRSFVLKRPGGYTLTEAGTRVRARLPLDDEERIRA